MSFVAGVEVGTTRRVSSKAAAFVLTLAMGAGLWGAGWQAGQHTASSADWETHDLPIRFLPNVGQADARAAYVAWAAPSAIFFDRSGAWIAADPSGAGRTVRLEFLDTDPEARLEAAEPSAGRVHYLRGADPAAWLTDVPAFGQLRYRDVWPGVDVVFHGQASTMKYDLILSETASVERVKLRYGGAEFRLRDDGSLEGRSDSHVLLTEAPPVAYERTSSGQRPVDAAYRVLERSPEGLVFGFRVGPRTPGTPLVIDPSIVFSTFVGGEGVDLANDVDLDSAGAAYIVGATTSNEFPTTEGTAQPERGTAATDNTEFFYDAFVVKLAPDGSDFEYATYLGGTGGLPSDPSELDLAQAVRVLDGRAYVTGWTHSFDFPTTPNAYDRQLGHNENYDDPRGVNLDADCPTNDANDCHDFYDAFLTVLTPDGKLAYSTFLGGEEADYAYDLFLRPGPGGVPDVYLTGYSASQTFPTTPGVRWPDAPEPEVHFNQLQGAPTPVQPIQKPVGFLAWLRPEGQRRADLVQSTLLQTDVEISNFKHIAVHPYGVAVDSQGFAHVTGWSSRQGYVTVNEFQADPLNSPRNTFLLTLSPDFSTLAYSTFLSGNNYDIGYGIDVDSDDYVYVAGGSPEDSFPARGGFETVPQGSGDAFVAKMDPRAGHDASLVWSTLLGGSGLDAAYGLRVDGQGRAYVVGDVLGEAARENPFPTTADALQRGFGGAADAFLARLSPDGACIEYATLIGGARDVSAKSVAVRPDGDAVVVGHTNDPALPLVGAPDAEQDAWEGFAIGIDLSDAASARCRPPPTTAPPLRIEWCGLFEPVPTLSVPAGGATSFDLGATNCGPRTWPGLGYTVYYEWIDDDPKWPAVDEDLTTQTRRQETLVEGGAATLGNNVLQAPSCIQNGITIPCPTGTYRGLASVRIDEPRTYLGRLGYSTELVVNVT